MSRHSVEATMIGIYGKNSMVSESECLVTLERVRHSTTKPIAKEPSGEGTETPAHLWHVKTVVRLRHGSADAQPLWATLDGKRSKLSMLADGVRCLKVFDRKARQRVQRTA